MVIYSYSRLSNYEQCPLSYKFRYIDKIKGVQGIEAFMGSRVHEALHELYKKVGLGEIPGLKQVLECYKELWNKEFNYELRIVKKGISARDYFEEGLKILADYYEKHSPFNENIIGMEKRIFMDLNGDGKYQLQGFIDKIIHNKEEGIYEIHDYKTGKWLPKQKELDEDKQLALYSIGIKKLYPDAKGIVLNWYYLKHGMKLTSIRTDEQIEKLKQEIIGTIDKIESSTEWPANTSRLCGWCGYNHLCDKYKACNGRFF